MFQFLGFLLYCILVVVPFYRLLPRFGINPLWSTVSVTGIGLIVLLWVMASRAEKGELK